jgi:hypothetical protein
LFVTDALLTHRRPHKTEKTCALYRMFEVGQFAGEYGENLQHRGGASNLRPAHTCSKAVILLHVQCKTCATPTRKTHVAQHSLEHLYVLISTRVAIRTAVPVVDLIPTCSVQTPFYHGPHRSARAWSQNVWPLEVTYQQLST